MMDRCSISARSRMRSCRLVEILAFPLLVVPSRSTLTIPILVMGPVVGQTCGKAKGCSAAGPMRRLRRPRLHPRRTRQNTMPSQLPSLPSHLPGLQRRRLHRKRTRPSHPMPSLQRGPVTKPSYEVVEGAICCRDCRMCHVGDCLLPNVCDASDEAEAVRIEQRQAEREAFRLAHPRRVVQPVRENLEWY